jgi:hypothetical protein
MLSRVSALVLIVLIMLPFTAPLVTYDLSSHPVSPASRLGTGRLLPALRHDVASSILPSSRRVSRVRILTSVRARVPAILPTASLALRAESARGLFIPPAISPTHLRI